MTLTRKNVEFAKRVFVDRLGDPYLYGGVYDAFHLGVGADCSGSAGIFIGAALLGADHMSWTRQFTTEDFPGGFAGFRQVSQSDLLSGNYPIKVCIHHGGGGPNSHMQMQLDGVVMESNGDHGTCTTGRGAMSPADNYWNDWWVLDGSIVEDGTPRTEIPMTINGIDYAGGRPSGADIKAAGYGFACRYLSDGGPGLPGKQLLASEVADLTANGIGIVFNWETTGTTAKGGFNAGVADAQAALRSVIAAVGSDPGKPIYFSLDWDATPDDQTAINAYFQGVASVIGLERTGIYGGYWPVSRALDAGLVKWAWQCQAWSGSNQDPRINILQNNNAGYATVGGVQCDIDIALTDDFGQYTGVAAPPPPPVTPPPAEPTLADVLAVVRDIQLQLRGPDLKGWPQLGKNAAGEDLTLIDAIAAIMKKVGL